MTKKIIKQLAKQSFDNRNLDEKKISLITVKLKKTDARSYIQALKQITQQNTVLVQSPIAIDAVVQKQLQIKFPNKKVVYTINKDLLAGMRIVDNDLLYDYSLGTKIDKISRHSYDFND